MQRPTYTPDFLEHTLISTFSFFIDIAYPSRLISPISKSISDHLHSLMIPKLQFLSFALPTLGSR